MPDADLPLPEPTSPEQITHDQSSQDKSTEEKSFEGQAFESNASTEQFSPEESSLEQASLEQPAANQSLQDQNLPEQPSEEQALEKQPLPGQEQPMQEQASAEEAANEKAVNEKASGNATDSQSHGIPSKDDANGDMDGEMNGEMASLLKLALTELQQRRQQLKQEVEELSKRKSQLEKELTNSFAGQSDGIARRVKGFQDYLTGALQDLAQSVEQLELVVQPVVVQPSPLDQAKSSETTEAEPATLAVADTFKPDEPLIRECLGQFLSQPDFYAEPWKLRRSLDSKDTSLLEDWFFSQGGRGAQPSRGSRPRNVLVAAALIAILGELYGERFQSLILAGQPERLGEWRRGLQDALGLGREDFGPNSGIVLFERGDALVERADRLEDRGEVPLILIDAAEGSVEIPVLQFPLWLAFAAGPEERFEYEDLL